MSVAASDDSFPAAVARAFELATDASSIQRARDLAHAEDWNAKAGELFRLLQPGTARGNEPAAVGLAPPLAAGSPWS
jgi:hypothetical protein